MKYSLSNDRINEYNKTEDKKCRNREASNITRSITNFNQKV